MTEPYRRPAIGSRPHLYRLIRDNAYYPAGTVVCLDEDQVTGYHHERIRVESDDTGRVDELVAQNQSLTDAVMVLTARIHDLEVAHTEPVISVDPPPPVPVPEASSAASAETPDVVPDALKPD